MTRSRLVACPACARHVRVSESECPFCHAVLAASLRQSAPPQPPAVRLSRAALFALGTGALAVVPGCSSSSVSPIPPYGLPPMPEAGGDAPVGADASGSDSGHD